MDDQAYNKIQINRTTKFGIDRFGKKVSETDIMFNIRADNVDEAVKLYNELLDKYYEKNKAAKEASK